MRHWPYHKPSCQELRAIGRNMHMSPSSTELHTTSVLLTSSSSDNSDQAEILDKEDTMQEYPNNSCVHNTIASKTECKKHGERNCDSEKESSTKNAILPEKMTDGYTVTIFIKHNKVKSQLTVSLTDDGSSILQIISDYVSIPVSKLKLIHKGKIATIDNIKDMLCNKALFLAFGEISEDEEGLEHSDIDLIVKQLNVERNLAIKILRKTGNVLDAIIEIGNM